MSTAAISSSSAPSPWHEGYTIARKDPVNSIVLVELVLQSPMHLLTTDVSILKEMPAQTSLLTGNINITPTKEYEAQNKKTFKHFDVAGLGSQRRRGD